MGRGFIWLPCVSQSVSVRCEVVNGLKRRHALRQRSGSHRKAAARAGVIHARPQLDIQRRAAGIGVLTRQYIGARLVVFARDDPGVPTDGHRVSAGRGTCGYPVRAEVKAAVGHDVAAHSYSPVAPRFQRMKDHFCAASRLTVTKHGAEHGKQRLLQIAVGSPSRPGEARREQQDDHCCHQAMHAASSVRMFQPHRHARVPYVLTRLRCNQSASLC